VGFQIVGLIENEPTLGALTQIVEIAFEQVVIDDHPSAYNILGNRFGIHDVYVYVGENQMDLSLPVVFH